MGTIASAISPWAATSKVTENEARLALGASWAKAQGSAYLSETGVVESAGPTASVSGNSIVVTAHQCVVEDASGTWVCTTTASLSCPLQTPLPSAGQSRYDLIVAEVVSGDFQLRSVTGTASGSPSVPGVPANTIGLFRTLVTNSGPQAPVAIFGWTRAPGGIRLCETGDTRQGSFTGDLRRFRSGQIDVWSGSTWVTVAAPQAWTEFTPTLYAAGTGAISLGTGGTAIGRYIIQGKVCHLRYVFRAARQSQGFNGGWGDVSTRLPPGITSAPSEETQILSKINVAPANSDSLYAIFMGKCFIPPTSTMMNLYFPVDYDHSGLHTYMVSLDSGGTAGSGFPTVPGDYPRPLILTIQGTLEIS